MSRTFNSHARPALARRLFAAAALLLLLSPAAAAQAPAPPAADALAPGRPVARELAGGQSHAYLLELAAGQFVRVVVEQRGVDVVAAVRGPEGAALAEVDSPNGAQGPEPVSFVTRTSGAHAVEVRSLEQEAAPGAYEIRVEEVRAATPRDPSFIEAETAAREALTLYMQHTADTLRAAIPRFEAALAIWQRLGDRARESEALGALGIIHDDLGERPRAVAYFTRQLPLVRAAGDRAAEGTTLHNLALAYKNLGEHRKALDFYTQALDARRAAGDRAGEAATLHDIGDVNFQLGEHDRALALYGQTLALFRADHNTYGEAVTLRDVGLVHKARGEPARAAEFFRQSLPRIREAGDKRREAATLNDLGNAHKALGELPQALAYFTQSLGVSRAVGDRVVEAYTLGSIGTVRDDLGEKQQALDSFEQALAMMRAAGDRYGEAIILGNLGALYGALGEPARALDYYTRALALARATGDRTSQAYGLVNLGQAHRRAGDAAQALAHFEQALPVMREIGVRDGEARALEALADLRHASGQHRRALADAAQALAIYRAIGNRLKEARALSNVGVVHASLKEWPQALDCYERALALSRAVGDRGGEADTLYHAGRAELALGRHDEARSHAEEAVRIVEAIRGQLAGQELRASYRSTAQRFYDLHVETLMRMHQRRRAEGFDAQALQASERARARMLLESLGEAGADIRQGADPELVKEERELGRQLDAKVNSQFRLLAGLHTPEAARALAAEVAELTARFGRVRARIRATSPRYAALTQPATLSAREIQTAVLDADTLLLEYSLGEERSYVWAVTRDSLTSAELPKRAEIEALARAAYRKLTSPPAAGARALPEELTRLSAAVLGPVAARMKARRVVVVADGALQYVPFAALPAPGGAAPLVAAHEVVSLPSASTLAVLRREAEGREPAPKALAVLADPVFGRDDPRVRRTPQAVGERVAAAGDDTPRELRGLGLFADAADNEADVARPALRSIPRLPGTRREAQGLLALVAPDERKAAFDFEASRETVAAGGLEQYRLVHLATHGYVDSARPELSGVLLSMLDERGEPRDGFMRAGEVYNLRLRADLVVLSACQTGLGREVRGEGLVGLTRGFMYAGAPRVVSSLWNVSDAATAELMTDFYEGMLRDRLRPAEALRRAQLAMWERGRWTAPYYWAAFTLQGEWR